MTSGSVVVSTARAQVPRSAEAARAHAHGIGVAHRPAGPVSRPPRAPRRAGSQRRPCRAPAPTLLPTNRARSWSGQSRTPSRLRGERSATAVPRGRRGRQGASCTGVEPAVGSGLRGARANLGRSRSEESVCGLWESRWNAPSGRELSLTPAGWVAVQVRRWADPRCGGRTAASGWWCRPCWRAGSRSAGSSCCSLC